VLAWTAIWGHARGAGDRALGRDVGRAVPGELAPDRLGEGLLGGATVESPFTHLWSLAIEGAVLRRVAAARLAAAPGRPRRTAPARVDGRRALASAAALALLYESAGATRAYMARDTRAFALLFGALFALDPVQLVWPRS
jgi:peptidoglycan/LPS O-acetylase OafA/YrhL